MGNSQSSPSKNEIRRANRLSKPLTKKSLALSSPQLPQPPFDQSELSGGLVGWHNPWPTSTVSRDFRNSYLRAREIPPPLFESEETPDRTDSVDQPQRHYPASYSLPPSPGSLSASPSVRRASYQSGPAGSSSQSSLVPEPPRRANSIQSPLSRRGSAIYDDFIENATSSNTHFLVGNQRFSLTRRRSLLTRPGVATRRTTGAVRRMPSPIGEPESPVDDRSEFQAAQWPVPPRQRPPLSVAPPARPTSPADVRYTQLGALKLGSLRVVNGSASPCPSERIPLAGSLPTGPGLGLDNVEAMSPRGVMLEIPAVVDTRKSDDVPGSPFSFEKSPILAVQTEPKAILSGEMEDEGIGMCDDGSDALEKGAMQIGIDRSTSRSLNNSDSGYSSAASVRSFHRSRTRASLDSQASNLCAADSTRNTWISGDQLATRPGHQVQRHLSLQEARPGNFSRLHPACPRWYESPGSTTESSSDVRPRRSTFCAPKYTEFRASDVVLGGTQAALVDSSSSVAYRGDQPAISRGHFSTSSLNVTTRGSGSLMTLETPPACPEFAGIDTKLRMHRSASERRVGSVKQEAFSNQPRSRSRPGSRVWCQVPGIDVPPLPTILSPDRARDGAKTGDELFSSEPHRGRPRSLSHDGRRRRLTKAQPLLFL